MGSERRDVEIIFRIFIFICISWMGTSPAGEGIKKRTEICLLQISNDKTVVGGCALKKSKSSEDTDADPGGAREKSE